MLVNIGGKKIDAKAQLLDIDRTNYEDSLYDFMRAAWPIFDAHRWVDGWALQAICEHLQAVIDGEIKRLLINIPPRCGKSASCSIALLPWCWAQRDHSFTSGPGVSFLYASFKDSLSLRDATKCRNVLESNWYQTYWGDRFQLTQDQNSKSRFRNDKAGERLITSIGAKGATGDGGDIIVIDDPNSAKEIESELAIQSVIDWWDGVMGTRLNDIDEGAFIEIQQRVAANDLTGHILENQVDDWVHLVLPMHYEPERSFITTIGWKDPRLIPGELLWPERFSAQAVDRLASQMGSWRAAGQLEQRPVPRGGGIIKTEWWLPWPEKRLPAMDYIIAYLDTAYTEDTMNDPSGIIIWGVFSADQAGTGVASRILDKEGRPVYADRTVNENGSRVMAMYAWKDRLELHPLVNRVERTCTHWKVDLLLIENKASGISVAQELRRLFQNSRFSVQLNDPKSQDKAARLYSVQHLFEEGLIYAPSPEDPEKTIAWVDEMIDEVSVFPKGRHDEYVDCTSGALRHLRNQGLISRPPESKAEYEGLKVYRRNDIPLYPS